MREGGGGRWEGEREEVGGWISGLVHQEFTSACRGVRYVRTATDGTTRGEISNVLIVHVSGGGVKLWYAQKLRLINY